VADSNLNKKAPKVRGRGADDSAKSTTGPKSNPPAKPKREKKFRTTARGYSKDQVDKTVRGLNAELDRAAAIIVQKDRELETAKAAETEAVDKAFFYIMDLKERLLKNAEARAEQIISDANRQAGGGSSGAPDELVKAAKAEAARIVTAARAEAQRLETFGPSAGAKPVDKAQPIPMGEASESVAEGTPDIKAMRAEAKKLLKDAKTEAKNLTREARSERKAAKPDRRGQ
jgi:cell division septum initiation protein DivIVA